MQFSQGRTRNFPPWHYWKQQQHDLECHSMPLGVHWVCLPQKSSYSIHLTVPSVFEGQNFHIWFKGTMQMKQLLHFLYIKQVMLCTPICKETRNKVRRWVIHFPLAFSVVVTDRYGIKGTHYHLSVTHAHWQSATDGISITWPNG